MTGTGYTFLDPVFAGLWYPGFLKSSKDGSKEGIQYLNLVHALAADAHLIEQGGAHIFPSLPFVTYVIIEGLLVIFITPGLIQI
ncbi:hypothetical protein TURU_103446 [Turdus rufiventris]|nr:hypothetical protein TURU_103446 [Turdus rufiventris]